MRLVTLQQARDQIRSTETADDNDLLLKIEAASKAVLNYIGDAADIFLDTSGQVQEDSSGDPIQDDIPKEVIQAVLVLVDELYNKRGSSEAKNFNYLPDTVIYLLYPLRKPVIG